MSKDLSMDSREEAQVMVYNMLGTLVYETQANAEKTTIPIHLNAGMYIVQAR
jgi:hypothetical protein